MTDKSGVSVPFRYYFCQREAIEMIVYLYESRKIRSLSGMTAEFLGRRAKRAALGIDPAATAGGQTGRKVYHPPPNRARR